MVTKRKNRTTEETFDDVVLAVHGGAGGITRQNMNAAGEREYNKHLQAALTAGFQLLKKGRNALDAVEAAIRYLEDCPLFNAGHGAVFTCDGKNELDAAIMNGKNHAAGAVASVSAPPRGWVRPSGPAEDTGSRPRHQPGDAGRALPAPVGQDAAHA